MTPSLQTERLRTGGRLFALALGLGAPGLLGVTIAQLARFYPDTSLAVALQAGGIAIAALPLPLLAIGRRAARR
jgi:hypothetical protein